MTIAAMAGTARAADPQPYTVAFNTTGNAELDLALKDSSTLLSLSQSAPAGPFALVARAQNDVERFAVALHSFGFYQGCAKVRIAGRALDDPGLFDLLARAPASPPVQVSVSVEQGPLFHLRKIEIQGNVPRQAAGSLKLEPGAPALAADVLAARERLLAALRDDGYALAKIDEPVAILAPEARALDIGYKVDAGPQVTLGKISVTGLERVNEAFVSRRLLVFYGDPFNPGSIEKTRQDLVSTGVFSSVRTRVAEQLDGQGRLPVTFEVSERPRRAASVGAAYSTDLGGSFSTTWQHRNLFGNAEQLNLTAGVTQLGGNSTTGIGYKAVAGFVKPDFLLRDQSLQANLGGIKQSLIAYDQKAITGDISLARKFAKHWSYGIGLAGEQSQISQEGETNHYTLLSLPLSLKYDNSNSLLDPTQGIRAGVSLTPIQPLSGPRATTFFLMQVSGSAYLDLGEPGRSVLALRGMAGDTQGASQFELPPDKRFYAGGSATVRGFKYQSIGPQFPDQKPQGGISMATGTVEFRQRFLDNYGAVVFVDAGQVNAAGSPFSGTWRLGAGVGARYYTAFGPIRLDVAMPVNKQAGSGSFELYIGLGQAF